MQLYLGVKIVSATPMSRADYNMYRGWDLPENENGEDPGYLVEYMDGGKPNDPRHEGYISWCPEEQFQRANRQVDGMTFGHAIEAMKSGRKVARKGWNGKGMWVIYVPGTENAEMKEGSAYKNAGIDRCDILPHFDMWTINAEGRRAMLPGWVASQSDMAAEDWQIVG